MSVRAYRINKIDHSDVPTFNLWHDENIIKWLESNCGFVNEEKDIIELAVSSLEALLKSDVEIEDITRKDIEIDIDWAKKEGEEYIQYLCY